MTSPSKPLTSGQLGKIGAISREASRQAAQDLRNTLVNMSPIEQLDLSGVYNDGDKIYMDLCVDFDFLLAVEFELVTRNDEDESADQSPYGDAYLAVRIESLAENPAGWSLPVDIENEDVTSLRGKIQVEQIAQAVHSKLVSPEFIERLQANGTDTSWAPTAKSADRPK